MRVEIRQCVRRVLDEGARRGRGTGRRVWVGGVIHDHGVELLCGAADLSFAPAPGAVEDNAHAHAAADDETERVVHHAGAVAALIGGLLLALVLLLIVVVEHGGHAGVAERGGLREAMEAAAAGAFFPELREDFGEAVEEVVGPDFGFS